MKLLILSDMFPSVATPGNGRFVAGQAVELARRMDLTVLVPVVWPLSPRRWRERKDSWALALPPDVALSPEHVRYLPYPGLPWRLDSLNVYLAYFAVRRAIRRLRLAPDIIHCHPSYPAGYVGYLVAQRLGVPVVATLHGFDINVFAHSEDYDKYSDDPAFPNLFYSPRTRRRVVTTLLHCDRVVSVSEELRKKAEALGLLPNRAVVIRNGVDASQFYPTNTADARRKLRLPEQSHIILFVGTLTHRKGPLILIEAARLLRDAGRPVHLVLLGDGDQRAEAQRLASRYGLGSSVYLPGPITHSEIPLWMNACDVLSLPTYYESFGVVLLEALACGKPIVTTRAGGIPDFVQDGVHGDLVPPGDPSSLAQAIAQVLDRRWDRDALARYAHGLSWEKVASELENVYIDILAKRQQGLTTRTWAVQRPRKG
ncbi:MAG: glycosyltransferase family 4 protein [Chloroflexi bacterium]|nr:glycosyltransferase family 4 protein [Chloroflexota bacterium]